MPSDNRIIKETAQIVANEALTSDIFRIRIRTETALKATPGQFVNVCMRDGAHLLPRPISICDIDEGTQQLTLVYRSVGVGTTWLSRQKAGDGVDIIGPLGNGFFTAANETDTKKKALIVGGGVGIPPMLALAKAWRGDADVVLGYRNEAFLREDFEETGYPVFVTSDTGSVGQKGTVMDAIREEKLHAGIILACGPKPMLAALKAYATQQDIPCYLSMEERMACGIGACLACVCETSGRDAHSKVHNARVCKDGPVFEAKEVVL